MPSLAGNYNPAAGVLIQVSILPPEQAIQAANPQQNSTDSIKDFKVYMALIDTGASCTCISAKVVNDVGLKPTGKTKMSGSTGADEVDQFTFSVGFMFGAQQLPSGKISGALHIHLVNGCKFEDHGFGFDVLLGRDIICKGSFSMSFDGHFILSL
ncbi:MAG: aspartyl protease family protein [Proteobacteria bacterium]|nr:aspartyl protease family protein [Pseudomonadota bacterium]